MTVRFTFDPSKYVSEKKQGVIEAINISLSELNKEIKINSPTDTKRFIQNHKIVPAHSIGDKTIGKIENDTPYAIYLEMGVMGRTYAYHKGPPRDESTEFYRGVGVRTYARSLDNMRNKIIDNIIKYTT